MMKDLRPGKSKRVREVEDLDPAVFRRLVARRARQVLDSEVGPSRPSATESVLSAASTNTSRRFILERIFFPPGSSSTARPEHGPSVGSGPPTHSALAS